MATKLQRIDLRIEFVGDDTVRERMSDVVEEEVRKVLSFGFRSGELTEPHVEEINFELNDSREPVVKPVGVREEWPKNE